MQILQETQKNFESLGFNPKLERFNHRIIRILIMTCTCVASQWIFLIHVADSAQEYMESTYMVTVCSGFFLSFASTILIRMKLFSFIKTLDESVNARLENPTLKAIFEKSNEFVEKWTKIGIFVMKYVILLCIILPRTIYSFFIYFTTDLGNDAFVLPAPMWFPYDWRNPIGYLVSIFLQFILGMLPFQYIGSLASLAFGAFMFAISFVKFMKKELRSINKMSNKRKSRKNMYKKFSEFVHGHTDAKEFFISFSDLYEISLTILFFGIIIAFCAVMLMVQIEISHNETDSMSLLVGIIFGGSAAILMLFVCELGQRFTDSIDEIDDTIITLNWYLYPTEIQRVLPMVMSNTQKPVVIKCFGNVQCSREQFKKVFRTIYSYFTTLRKFYE